MDMIKRLRIKFITLSMFYATYSDVSFISNHCISGAVIVVIHERLDTDGGGLAVVGNLLV